MRLRSHRGIDPLWIAAALLALVLPALALTQYVWLTRLSEWQQRRTLQLLQAGADRLAQEFSDAIEPFQGAFQMVVDPGTLRGLEEQLAVAWRMVTEKSPLPARDLVRHVLWLAPTPDGGFAVREFLPERGRLETRTWPAELTSLRDSLRQARGATSPGYGALGLRLERGTPLLLIPRPPDTATAGAARAAWVVLILDRDLIARRLLPDLVRKYLADRDAPDLQVAVTCSTDPPTLFYASTPGLSPGVMRRHDAAADLLGLRTRAMLVVRAPRAASTPREVVHGQPPLAPQQWRLLVRHRAGSVEAWARGVRTRNLLLSGGMLAVLAGSVLVLLGAAARARRLAQLQMDFISGVSHELRTPLAVISAAGENLADAVVADPARTQEYGRVIHREGRRLGRMVDRVLQFARLRAEAPGRAVRSVSAGELIAEALETYRLEIGERHILVRTEAPADLPPIPGDRDGLLAAIENLLSNAIKYGGDGGEMTIHAAAASLAGRPAVEIAVSDRGPGIPEGERARVFEPFARGRDAREHQIKGSGLGLSLVRDVALAHDGCVHIEQASGGGARVVLTLPAHGAAFGGGSVGA